MRTARERAFQVLAILLLLGPFVAGVIRAASARRDFRLLAMAFAAYVAVGLVVALTRARQRAAVASGTIMIFVLGMVLAFATGFALGARAGPGTLMVAFVLALFCAAGFASYAASRPQEKSANVAIQ